MKRVLEFKAYDVTAKIVAGDPTTYEPLWPKLIYHLIRSALEYLPNQSGKKEKRKRLRELLRKVRKIGEWYEDLVTTRYPDGRVETEKKKDWRLRPEGGIVPMVQAELDLLRECWEKFMGDAGMDVEVSVAADDMLENVPEWDDDRVKAAGVEIVDAPV